MQNLIYNKIKHIQIKFQLLKEMEKLNLLMFFTKMKN